MSIVPMCALGKYLKRNQTKRRQWLVIEVLEQRPSAERVSPYGRAKEREVWLRIGKAIVHVTFQRWYNCFDHLCKESHRCSQDGQQCTRNVNTRFDAGGTFLNGGGGVRGSFDLRGFGESLDVKHLLDLNLAASEHD